MAQQQYYIYKFIDHEHRVIYVGKSKLRLTNRFQNHSHLPKDCYEKVERIEFIECVSENEMDIKELYYINKFYKEFKEYNYNKASVTEAMIHDVEFDDAWKAYCEALPEAFCNSVNFKENYQNEELVRYNLDGSVCKIRSNREKGKDYMIAPIKEREKIKRLFEYLEQYTGDDDSIRIKESRINAARNRLLITMALNTPLKINAILELKHKDIVDEEFNFKTIRWEKRYQYQNLITEVRLNSNVQEAYHNYINVLQQVNYFGCKREEVLKREQEGYLYISRKTNHPLTVPTCNRIIKKIGGEIGIDNNLSPEALRKTYGYWVYTRAEDKISALAYLQFQFNQRSLIDTLSYIGMPFTQEVKEYYDSDGFGINGKI